MSAAERFARTNKDDAWTVFFDEREKLINAWDKLDKPVFVLTGDLHNSFVIKITDNVWEMASGPHNSNNHWASDEGDRQCERQVQVWPARGRHLVVQLLSALTFREIS